MAKRYKLDEIVYKRLKTRGLSLICSRKECSKEIVVGDQVISRRCGKGTPGCNPGFYENYPRTKLYHEECWEKLKVM